jgi:two-component system, response regulator RegA
MDSDPFAARTVLVVDEDAASTGRISRCLQGFGYQAVVVQDFSAATAMNRQFRPDVILTELKLGGIWACDVLPRLKHANPTVRTAIVTNYPSVATAVRAMRTGFDTYMGKPLSTPLLLEALGQERWAMSTGSAGAAGDDGDRAARAGWPSLDRTIWEYINQVFVSAGTMSEAARRLGIDRRSLRRMLAKHPPIR